MGERVYLVSLNFIPNTFSCLSCFVLLHPHNVSQDHPNIVRLEEVYESHSEIYLVQEVCKGGELFDRLDEQPDYHYTEAQVSVNWTDRDRGWGRECNRCLLCG